ncbi:MAG: hypothetical protein IJ083_03290 [Clostridia bacterium]|nr:hypothetical protein [Clostridia bacterium]
MTVTLEKEKLQRVLRIFDVLDSADAHFKACQNSQYRTFVRSQVGADNTRRLVEELEALLKADAKAHTVTA